MLTKKTTETIVNTIKVHGSVIGALFFASVYIELTGMQEGILKAFTPFLLLMVGITLVAAIVVWRWGDRS